MQAILNVDAEGNITSFSLPEKTPEMSIITVELPDDFDIDILGSCQVVDGEVVPRKLTESNPIDVDTMDKLAAVHRLKQADQWELLSASRKLEILEFENALNSALSHGTVIPEAPDLSTESLGKAEAIRIAREVVEHSALLSITETASDVELLQLVPVAREWVVGQTYKQGELLVYNNQPYQVIPDSVIAQSHQVPGGAGMVSVYRPVVMDVSGSKSDPIPFLYGMKVVKDKYYSYNDKVYLAKQDVDTCVWYPGAAGVYIFQAT